jgi:nitroreductase
MALLDVFQKRKSVRGYKDDPIPEDMLMRVMEAARLAPSGKNFQPWKFIIVRDADMRKNLAEASRGQTFMAKAPIIIVACGFPERSYQRQGNYMSSWAIDVSIAVEHLMLQAQEEGLGTCWIGAFEEKEVKRLMGIPSKVKVLALTPLGYPDEKPRDRGRKPLEDIISYETF